MPWTEINGVKTFVAADATTERGHAPAPAPGGKSWVARHKALTAIGAGVAAIALIAAVAPSDTTPPTSASSKTQPAAQTPAQPVVEPEKPAVVEPEAPAAVEPEAPAVEPEPVVEPEPEPVKPSATRAQENAVRKAESYLDIMAFARSELIDQLKHDGFNGADATYGVNHIDVDWNEQAEKKAESYLDIMAFSRSELIGQLEHDGFTAAQARHGVNKAGL